MSDQIECEFCMREPGEAPCQVELAAARDANYEFLLAAIRVWREIDALSAEPTGYRGLDSSTSLRVQERQAWEALRSFLDDPVFLGRGVVAE